MEHGVGVVGLGHAFGQAADGKEAAEEHIDGSQVSVVASAVLCVCCPSLPVACYHCLSLVAIDPRP
jgi:hypothetical protein